MPTQNEKLVKSAKLFKVAIHADIIEAELTDINPSRSIEGVRLIVLAEKLLKSAKEFRKEYEGINPAFKEKLGDIIDAVDESLLKILQ